MRWLGFRDMQPSEIQPDYILIYGTTDSLNLSCGFTGFAGQSTLDDRWNLSEKKLIIELNSFITGARSAGQNVPVIDAGVPEHLEDCPSVHNLTLEQADRIIQAVGGHSIGY